ncbi:MAG: hypothetical protein ACLR0F_14035 [Eisenbergiella sp.]
MSIVSGYKKFKKYILTSSGFQLVSHWTKANTLEFDDGKTAQAKLGAIDGISSSRESNSDKIAASTALVSELNSDLGGLSFYEDATGKYVMGADSVPKKLGKNPIVMPELWAYVGGANRQCQVAYKFNVEDYETFYIEKIEKYNNQWITYSFVGTTSGGISTNLSYSIGKDMNISPYVLLRITLTPGSDTGKESFVRITNLRIS